MFVIGIFEHVVWAPARRIGWIQQTPQFSLSLLLSFHLSQSVWKQLSCLTDRLTYTRHGHTLLCESPVLCLSLARAETHVKRKLFPSLCSNSYHTAKKRERDRCFTSLALPLITVNVCRSLQLLSCCDWSKIRE